jgi:polyphosphate glucokinase
MKTLVIDIGGTNVKMLATGQDKARKFPSGPRLTALQMVENVQRATTDWEFDGVSIGYPGPVIHNKLALEPRNLAPGWVDFDFTTAFGKPVKLINDAAMQALGSYEGGRMLFLGLGTGLGSALIIDGVIAPLELAHLPYRKCRTFEDYVGLRGLVRLGKKKWTRAVADVTARLQAAMVADSVVLGGGNAKKLKRLPTGARLGLNTNAFLGGFRLWDPHAREHSAVR